MKRLLMLTIAAAIWASAPAKAADQLDLSIVKCKDFVESSKDNISLILMWLEGYYSDEDSPPIVDFDKMQVNGRKLGEYCGRNPGHSVITAADKVMGEK